MTLSNGVINFNGKNQYVDITWTANSNSQEIMAARNGTGDFSFTIDNISVQEVVDFDFDRNSTGTRVNEDYLIEDVPYNLVTNSETFSNWTKNNTTVTVNSIIAPDRTLSGALLQGSTVSNRHNVVKTGISDEQTVTLSVFVKKKELRYVQIASVNSSNQHANFDVQDVVIGNVGAGFSNAKIESAGNGWYRLSVVSLNRYNGFYISLISGLTAAWLESWSMTNNTDGLYIWGAQIVKGDQPKDYLKTTDRLDIPRIDYTNGEPSIKLEPQRQNLITYSEDLTQWSNLLYTIVTANSTTSPDGSVNADKLVAGTTNGLQLRIAPLSLTSGNTYTFSTFVKNYGGNYVILYMNDSSSQGIKVDLINETFTVMGASTNHFIKKFSNGWYQIGFTRTISTNVSGLKCSSVFRW